MLTELNSKKKVVGTKQTLKAIEEKAVTLIFLAEDIDQEIKEKIMQVASASNIPVEFVDSKLKLGRACGIDVSAASAALLK